MVRRLIWSLGSKTAFICLEKKATVYAVYFEQALYTKDSLTQQNLIHKQNPGLLFLLHKNCEVTWAGLALSAILVDQIRS